MAGRKIARRIRITVLLGVLCGVAANTWLMQRTATDWQQPLRVTIYPIDADGSPATAAYVAALTPAVFAPIETFFRREIARYGRASPQPVTVTLAAPLTEQPPELPRGRGPLQVAAWSLRLRYWVWRATPAADPPPQVRLYVLYHDPARRHRLDHSTGLEKGMIGLIKAFAAARMAEQNNVVISHELMHTLGATDKYEASTNQPRYPDGYAEPSLRPLYPQRRAEIMGGRIPSSAERSEIPAGLEEVVVGPETAREIRWID